MSENGVTDVTNGQSQELSEADAKLKDSVVLWTLEFCEEECAGKGCQVNRQRKANREAKRG